MSGDVVAPYGIPPSRPLRFFFFFFFEEASNFRGCYKLGVQRLKPKEGLEKKNGNSRIVSEQKGAAFCYGFIASG